jgi:hypothetical protein
MTPIILVAICSLVAAVVAALATLVVGRGQNRTTGIAALTDDQREFASQVLADNADMRKRISEMEILNTDFHRQTEATLRAQSVKLDEAEVLLRKYSLRVDELEKTLNKYNVPIPENGVH